MAKLRVVGQSKVGTIKAQFRETIGVDIQIYDQSGEPAANESTLGSIRTKRPTSVEITIRGQTLVKNVETFFETNYGVKIDIFASDGSLANNDVTLASVRRSYGLQDEPASNDDGNSDQREETGIMSENDSLTSDYAMNDDHETSLRFHVGFDPRKGGDGYRCRWFMCWRDLGDGRLIGAVGGYAGGGAFILENFYAEHQGETLSSLKIDLEDKISGDEIEFDEDVPEALVLVAEDAIDVAYEWCDQDEWEEAEQLFLKDDKKNELEDNDDMLIAGSAWHPSIPKILELAGVTAAPK